MHADKTDEETCDTECGWLWPHSRWEGRRRSRHKTERHQSPAPPEPEGPRQAATRRLTYFAQQGFGVVADARVAGLPPSFDSHGFPPHRGLPNLRRRQGSLLRPAAARGPRGPPQLSSPLRHHGFHTRAAVLKMQWGQFPLAHPLDCFAPLMNRTCQVSHPSPSTRCMFIMTLAILWSLASILAAVSLLHSD